MSTIHFGTDGWRARFDEDFTEENVMRVARAAGTLFAEKSPGAKILVGYDTRQDASLFAQLAAEVLAGCGLIAHVSEAYCPTPALCWSIAQDDECCGGLMLTASHNPADYLGIKIRMSDGGASPAHFTDQLEARLDTCGEPERRPCVEVDIMGPYLRHLKALADVTAIKEAQLQIVHDPMYGASRNYLAGLLRTLGVEVDQIHGEARSDFGGLHPEPIRPWIDECIERVQQTGAQMGIVNDGDADRIGAVDERGNFVNPHKIMALVVSHLLAQGKRGRVVTTFSGTSLLKRLCADHGLEYVVTPVGFKWIYQEMLAGNVMLGGEESGGIGIPDHVRERDGLLMALLLCEMVAQNKKPLSALVAELEASYGKFYYERKDMRLAPEQAAGLKEVLPTLEPKTIADKTVACSTTQDGFYAEFDDDSWVLLRLSGTEPLVRVYAESSEPETKEALLAWGCDLAQNPICS